jgi:RNA-directed DNA polymerase
MNIGEMQRKLSLWAEQDHERQFYDLYKLLCNMEWLQAACCHVEQNAGSKTAGCDGITMKDFKEHQETNLKRLQEDLKAGTFEPYPVRRVYIPKSHGKLRPLGIPSIRDRIIQEAIRMILEPIYAGTFCQSSYGFRPNRHTTDAIKCILFGAQEHKKYFWTIEGDIQSYLDTINHKKLIKLLQRRVKDQRLIQLLQKYLCAGVMEGTLFQETPEGTPQGGIVSPLLANIYLHELDKYMERYAGRFEKRKRRQAGKANYIYVRYCDDFVVLCNGTQTQAEDMKQELQLFLASELKLILSMEKTRVTHLNDGFKFLGFWIQRGRSGKGRMVTKHLIPKEAFNRCLGKVKGATKTTTHNDSVETKILSINRIMQGWCQYYQHTGKARTVFWRLDHYIFWEVARWLGRKFQLSTPKVMQKYRKGNSFTTGRATLTKAADTKIKPYKESFVKPNPYTTLKVELCRENLLTESHWMGQEPRPGMEDLRLQVLERDGYTCRLCGQEGLALATAHIDHKKRLYPMSQKEDAV